MSHITLNSAEQKLAIYIAKARYENARKRGIVDKKMGDQSCWETDLDGIGGEIAFCKFQNVYPDLETGNANLPDHDCIVAGTRVDVKTTKYLNGKLLATLGKEGKSVDCYALMVGIFPHYKYVGRATTEMLIDDRNIQDLGHGNGYALTQDQLI